MSSWRKLLAVLFLFVGLPGICFAPVSAGNSNAATNTCDIADGTINITNGSYGKLKVTCGNVTSFEVSNSEIITLTGTTTKDTVNVSAYGDVYLTLDNLIVTVAGTNPNETTGIDNKWSNPFFIGDSAIVFMTLKGTNVLTSTLNNFMIRFSAALRVPKNARLTIMGNSTDSLRAVTENTGAGIGGNAAANSSDKGEDCGAIIIEGGTVTAESKYGAGIGGGKGYGDSYGGNGGTITINGGTVTAESGFGGAGIGGGAPDEDSSKGGAGGAITINGGTIDATSKGTGAGIGGGEGGAGGTITIKGGTIDATSESIGAGIGGGEGGAGGTIIITGGTIDATSKEYYGNTSAAIGGKKDGSNDSVSIEPAAGNTLYVETKGVGQDAKFSDVSGSPIQNPGTISYSSLPTASDPYARIETATEGIGVTVTLKKDGQPYTGQTVTIQKSSGWKYALNESGTNGTYVNTAVPNGNYTLYKEACPAEKR